MKLIRLLLIFLFFPLLKAETIVCSFAILQNLCAQLCQGIDSIDVQAIVANSIDPHLYQPKPSDSILIGRANLVITNGLNLEGWIDNLIKSSDYKGQVIIASAGIHVRYLGNLPDPHIWHNPKLVMQMIDTITGGLQATFPAHVEQFLRNAASLKATFMELQKNIEELFATIPDDRRIMLTSHDAFSYFGECFKIEVHSPQGVSTSDDPSAHDMTKLIDQIRALGISAIFLEHLANPKILTAIATETQKNLKGTLYADTLKDDLSLQDTIWYNAVTIAEAMKKPLK